MRKQKVYADESYVHHHLYVESQKFYHDEDENVTNTTHKGLWFCSVTVIQAYGRLTYTGLVSGSFELFTPERTQRHFGDHHKMLNTENFMAYSQNGLLPNVHEPSIIIIENAKSHKRN